MARLAAFESTSLPTHILVVEPVSRSLSLYLGCRTRILVAEPVPWSSNPYRRCRIRILVVEPVSPLSNLYQRHGTCISFVGPTLSLSNPLRRCQTCIVDVESVWSSLNPWRRRQIICPRHHRVAVQERGGAGACWEGRSCWRQLLRHLGIERVSEWGGRRERERQKRTTTFIVVRFRHALAGLPTS
jgi:hypothetical protein